MFTFGTLVDVVAGFYIGCSGVVVDKLDFSGTQYMVEGDCSSSDKKTTYHLRFLVLEKELKAKGK